MLHHLFLCSACGERSPERLPLCQVCLESLIRCPALCPACGSPLCGSECLRPWAPLEPLSSLSAAYLFLGQGSDVLRAWKFRAGPLLDRRVLKMDGALASRLRALGTVAIVPVPQRFERAWTLKGSPAERIAAWVSREIGTPVARLLHPAASLTRQSRAGAEERFQNALRFEAEARPPEGPLLLVDDFVTTGHTLRSAARALSPGRSGSLHAFCLGLRLRGLKQERGHLSHRVGGTVAIRQA